MKCLHGVLETYWTAEHNVKSSIFEKIFVNITSEFVFIEQLSPCACAPMHDVCACGVPTCANECANTRTESTCTPQVETYQNIYEGLRINCVCRTPSWCGQQTSSRDNGPAGQRGKPRGLWEGLHSRVCCIMCETCVVFAVWYTNLLGPGDYCPEHLSATVGYFYDSLCYLCCGATQEDQHTRTHTTENLNCHILVPTTHDVISTSHRPHFAHANWAITSHTYTLYAWCGLP